MQLPIVWCCLKIDAGEPCTMPGFAVRTWHSPRGFHRLRRTHRLPIRWWWLARPIVTGGLISYRVQSCASSQAKAKPAPPKRSALQKRSPDADELAQPTGR